MVIGGFADAHIADMDDAGLAAFEALLTVPDQDLYAWIMGNAVPPAEFDNPMLDRLRQFGYSDRPVHT